MSKSSRPPAKRAAKQAGLDSDLVKALSHPLRMRILRRLNEAEASPNEMAKAFGESLPLVSYHVRILRELGCIELARTTPRRGAIEHHYRAVVRSSFGAADWAEVPPSVRAGMSATTLSTALDDVRGAVEAATFDERPDRHLSHTPLLLDEEGWAAVAARLAEVFDWARAQQDLSLARVRDGNPGATATEARLTMLCYVAAPDGAPAPTPDPAAGAKRRGAKR